MRQAFETRGAGARRQGALPTEAAVACANDNPFGLSAAVFSRDIAKARNVARRIHSGICHINAPTVHDEAQMPFGGVKESGYGHFGGRAGIDSFTDLRWITLQTTGRHYPFSTMTVQFQAAWAAAALCALLSQAAHAGGHYVAGVEGLQGSSVPPPGSYYLGHALGA